MEGPQNAVHSVRHACIFLLGKSFTAVSGGTGFESIPIYFQKSSKEFPLSLRQTLRRSVREREMMVLLLSFFFPSQTSNEAQKRKEREMSTKTKGGKRLCLHTERGRRGDGQISLAGAAAREGGMI